MSRLLLAFLIAGCAGNRARPAAAPPNDGVALLSRMHDAYRGKWFKTVTFVQQTIVKRPDGVTDTTTWYEALRSPDRLRIDFGDPQKGNGALYTADSLYVVRDGKVTRTVATGNPFLPFVAGVYDQPVDTTVRQIQPYKFELSRLSTATWEGRPAYVVGATAAGDSTSPQFWIDRERLIIVRMIVPLGPQLADIRLDDNVPVGGGWLATKVGIMVGGEMRQQEQYSQWRANADLPRDFFVAEKWSAVPHWAGGALQRH